MNALHGGTWKKGLALMLVCATAVIASANLRPAAVQVPAAAPTAVGIIKLPSLFAGLNEYQEGSKLIEEKRKEMQAKLSEVEASLKKLTEEYDLLKDPPIAKKLEMQIKLVELEALGNARKAAMTGALAVQAGDMMRSAYLKAVDAAKRLAASDGWDIILLDDRGIEPPARMDEGGGKSHPITAAEVNRIVQERHVIVANERVDVTPALIALMNNEYKAKK